MSGWIKQSTAHTFQLGPFIDDTDGKTAEAGLTIGDTDTFLSKHGGAAAAKNDTTDLTGTGDARGYYDCVLNTTDTGTVGKLKVMVHVSGALPVWDEFMVLPANVYDSLVAGTDELDVDVEKVAGTAQTGNDNGADINTLITEVGKVPKSDGSSTWNATALASIEAEALDALEGVQLDHLVGVTTGVAADGDLETYCVAGSLMSHILSIAADATNFKASTDSLQAVRDHIGDGTNLTEAGGDGDHLVEAGGDGDHLTNIGTIATCTTNTDMRGTDNAALASVVGALADAAAAGEVTSADTLMQYVKQLINILIGTPGIGAWPAEAAPGNAVSIAEAIRAIHTDVTGLNGDAMRGTDSAGTAAELAKVPKSDAAVSWNATALAAIEAEVTDSIEAHNLDHLCLTATAGADMTTEVADNTILSRILSNGDTSAFVPSTDGLQLIRDALVTEGGIWDDTEGITGDTHSYEKMLTTIFMFLFHETNITDATGALQVRNSGDTGNVITHTITDDDTTTDRTKSVIA